MTEDTVGAFVPGPRARLDGGATGPLAGLSFAVKDLYDLAGWPTTYGNPDWARSHPLPGANAPIVTELLEAGARCEGKTKTVEIAFGLTGENVWHGTPRNPAAPDRFPGGSSCGSAAAVAAGLVDFALGSDTGGSVRIPASYCGILGIRPSWGVVGLAGAGALAPSFDVAGWFARDGGVLRRVGEVLLPPGGEAPLGPLLRPVEAWANADAAVTRSLGDPLAQVAALLGPALDVQIAPEGLDQFYEAFRSASAAEIWATQGAWITAEAPEFGPGVGDRFAAARDTTPAQSAAGRALRRVVQARLRTLLAGGAVLVFPTAPGPAPLLTSTLAEQAAVRARTLGVTAFAGLAGLPEVSLPLGKVEGLPVGLSLVAGPGRDRALLALAESLVP